MKRKLLLCLSLLLLTGCAGEASMTLTPKKLKTQTENVLHILNWNGKFYDFQGKETKISKFYGGQKLKIICSLD